MACVRTVKMASTHARVRLVLLVKIVKKMFVHRIHVKIMDNARMQAVVKVVVQPLIVNALLAIRAIDVKYCFHAIIQVSCVKMAACARMTIWVAIHAVAAQAIVDNIVKHMFVHRIHVKIMDNARLQAVVVRPLIVNVQLALRAIDVK